MKTPRRAHPEKKMQASAPTETFTVSRGAFLVNSGFERTLASD